jgi:hypothetical protein
MPKSMILARPPRRPYVTKKGRYGLRGSAD